MTRRILLLTLCAVISTGQCLVAAQCGSWLSTPSRPPVTTCEYVDRPCDSQDKWRSYACDYGCNSRCGFNAGVDFLYWTACQDRLDFAVDHATADDPPTLLGTGDTHFLHYDWSPGVRAYLGVEVLGFGVRGQYTWIETKADGSKDYTDLDSVLVASLLHPSTGLTDATIAYGSQNLWYESADLLFSREAEFCDQKLILRPFIGANWMRIKQELEVTYEGEDFIDNPEQVRWDSTLSGPGAIAGFELFYRWLCGIGMYGKLAASITGAVIDNEHVQVALDSTGADIPPPQIQLEETQRICVPGYQLEAGITWDSCCWACYNIRFRLCYEFNQWLNTPQLRRYHFENEGVSNAATDGSIALHGGTFGIDLRF